MVGDDREAGAKTRNTGMSRGVGTVTKETISDDAVAQVHIPIVTRIILTGDTLIDPLREGEAPLHQFVRVKMRTVLQTDIVRMGNLNLDPTDTLDLRHHNRLLLVRIMRAQMTRMIVLLDSQL